MIDEIEQFAKKHRDDLPQDADEVGKSFQPRTFIERGRQQPVDDRDGFERINDAIGFICVFQPEGRNESFNHSHPF